MRTDRDALRRTAVVILAAAAAVLLLAVLPAGKSGLVKTYASAGRPAAVEPVRLPQGSVDVNGGNLEEIMALPGVGPKIGQAVIDERELHGPYFYPEDLLAVRGIGEKTLDKMRDMLLIVQTEERGR